VDEGGLSARGRTLAWVLALVLLLTGAGALSAAGLAPISGERAVGAARADGGRGGGAGGDEGAAGAAAVVDAQASGAEAHPAAPGSDPAEVADGGGAPAAAVDGAITAEWDGPTVHVDWTGERYTTVEADFVGDRVASPGDRVHRTLTLRNDGPEDAVLSVDLALGQDVPAGSPNPELGGAVDLFWDVAGVEGQERFAILHDAGRPTIAEARVAQGDTVPVTVGFTMPAEETGHRGGEAATTLHFRVLATMQGETGVDPGPGPSPEPDPGPGGEVPAPEPGEPDQAAPEAGGDGDLAVTGAHLLGAVLVLLGLLLIGWLLLALARRRRRCDLCGERVDRGEGWTVHHAEDGTRSVECAACARQGALDEREPAGLAR
jgi:hypothetical protein